MLTYWDWSARPDKTLAVTLTFTQRRLGTGDDRVHDLMASWRRFRWRADEANANFLVFAPDNLAPRLKAIKVNDQVECIRYIGNKIRTDACAGRRNVLDDAWDRAMAIVESGLCSLENPAARSRPLFIAVNCDPDYPAISSILP